MAEEGIITIKKDDVWKYTTLVLLAVVVIGAFFAFTGKGATGNTVTDPDTQPSVVKASIDDDAVLGNEDAPITIIEFSDYECPYCGRFWAETLPTIKSQYIDTGKVKFVYRDFPLSSIHPLAQPAAEATECVRSKGGDEAFWNYHNKIFGNQGSLSVANLNVWATELGYDITQCLGSGEFRSEVLKDTADAQSAGAQGTPYFVIMKSGSNSGKVLSGAYPFANFQEIIEAELA